jgi:hypothetical protein
MEAEESDILLPVNQDVSHSGIVIDLTASSPTRSPPPVIEEEPVNNSSVNGDKGKASVGFEYDIIDLTMDSDDDNC